MFTEFNWNEAIGSSPVFFVIVGCSVVALGIAIERAYYYWKHTGNPDKTLAIVLRELKAGDMKGVEWALEKSVHPIGAVASSIMNCLTREREHVEEQLQIALSQQKLLLERNLNILGTLAAVSPLIGLLGTVWGIMRAFGDMAITGSAAPSVVAAGVAEALITTAAGLVVAVPALMLYNHFTRRMNTMLTITENHARSIRMAFEETVRVSDRHLDHVPRDGAEKPMQSVVSRETVKADQPLHTR